MKSKTDKSTDTITNKSDAALLKLDKSKEQISLLSVDLQKELALLEIEAAEEAAKFVVRLKNVATQGSKILGQSLDEPHIGINSEDKKKTKAIFKQTILQRSQIIASSLLKSSLGKEENVPLNVVLLEALIDVLSSIQDFKIKVNKVLPIKCDEIIKYATPALLVVANAYAPSLGVVLKNTGALEKAASFLKDESLEATINTLRDTLGKLNKDKNLAVISQTSELSGYIEIPVEMLSKVGFNSKSLETVIQGVKETHGLKNFMQEVSSYAHKLFPQSEKEIDTTLLSIKKSVISAIEKTKSPQALITKIETDIDKHLGQVKATLKESLNPSVSVFDKIKIQQKSANLMLDCIKDITATVKTNISDSQNANLILNSGVEALKRVVKDQLQGDVSKIAKQVQEPLVKEFAKKTLGAGYANLMDIAKGAMKLLATDTSRSI